MVDLSKLDPKTLRSVSEILKLRFADDAKRRARVADSVVLMWLCRVGPDDWRYLHDTPEARAAHPTGRLVIRECLNGRRKLLACTLKMLLVPCAIVANKSLY